MHRVGGAGEGASERNREKVSGLLVSECPLMEAVQVKQRGLFCDLTCPGTRGREHRGNSHVAKR